MRKLLPIGLILFIFIGCASTGSLSDYYEQFMSDELLSLHPDNCFLQEGDEPNVFYSSNLRDDITLLKSKYYVILGWSAYNGPAEDDLEKYTFNFCKKKRALIGLYTYKYTDSRTGVYNIGNYINSYNIKRYDYDVVLFVSMPDYYIQNQKTGFEIKDLDTSSRQQLKRNTGVVVEVVYEKTNAFYANIIKDDVITQINGINIYSKNDYNTVYENLQKGQIVTLSIVRNSNEINITYKL